MYIVLCLGMKAVHSWYSSIILWFPFSKDSALCFDLQMWSDYDGLSKKVLKLCRSQISKPITYISNKSLTCGICPNRLKYAIIKPFFLKKGDKSQVSNYRPISLLTDLPKIFELLIFHRLKHHLVSNNILVNEQFGFCDNVYTGIAISKLIESIFNAWNNKEHIIGLFCDLTKAFDGVRYVLLILKLDFCGVKCCILNWLKSYLHNRKQRSVWYKSYCCTVHFVESLQLLTSTCTCINSI